MKNSKFHSTWHNLPGNDNPVNLGTIEPKTYVIIGKDISSSNSLPKDVVIIGDGESYIDLSKNNIEPGSRIIIHAHGGASLGKSVLCLEESGYTSYAFQNLSRSVKKSPVHVETFACHGGLAINNITDLPLNSTLMTFIDDKDEILLTNNRFLQESSFNFKDRENQFMRFASYLLISPHITKFALRGQNGNHFFFSDPASREDYSIDAIKLWQNELLKEYAVFLTTIKDDITLADKNKIEKVISLVNSERKLSKLINAFDAENYITDYLISKIVNNRLEEVEKILSLTSVNVNAKNKDGLSILYFAIHRGQLNLLEKLFEMGADANDKINGYTALWIASHEGHLNLVEKLLENKAEVNVLSDGESALWIAAKKGRLDVVEKLLVHNANIDAKNKNGLSVLHAASQDGHIEIVKKLLKHGANIRVLDDFGRSVLHVASQNGHIEIVEMLLQHGANVNSLDNNGWSVLHIATQNGRLEVVEALLKHGANINALNNSCSALNIASQNGNLEIVKLLLAKGGVVNLSDLDNLKLSDEIKAEIEQFRKDPKLYIKQNNNSIENEQTSLKNYYSSSPDSRVSLENLTYKLTEMKIESAPLGKEKEEENSKNSNYKNVKLKKMEVLNAHPDERILGKRKEFNDLAIDAQDIQLDKHAPETRKKMRPAVEQRIH